MTWQRTVRKPMVWAAALLVVAALTIFNLYWPGLQDNSGAADIHRFKYPLTGAASFRDHDRLYPRRQTLASGPERV